MTAVKKKSPAKPPAKKNTVKKTAAKKPAPKKSHTVPGSAKPQDIALHKLRVWTGNVRRTAAETNLGELVASIETHGLLQPLVVFRAADGYQIVAGKRRLLAIHKLNKSGKWGDNREVPCLVLEGDAQEMETMKEVSLHENVVREPMHPLDMAEAFAALLSEGKTHADVGARFGVSETVVKKRTALDAVAPEVKSAYRAGDLNLEQAQAFTVTQDHELQAAVLLDVNDGWDGEDIRSALTENSLDANCALAKFVTLAAYRKAGGTVTQDLFAEDDDAGTIDNPDILQNLAADKLKKTAEKIHAEKWAWVVVETKSTHHHDTHVRIWPEKAPLDPAHQAEYDRLTAQKEELDEKYEAVAQDSEEEEKLIEQYDAIDKRIEELDKREKFWPDHILAAAGVFVGIDHNGKLEIDRGWMKKEDHKKFQQAEARDNDKTSGTKQGAGGGADDAEANEPQGISLSKPLTLDLTQQRQAALGAKLAGDPDLGYKSIVFTLACDFFRNDIEKDNTTPCLNIHMSQAAIDSGLREPGRCKGWEDLSAIRAAWLKILPKTAAELWAWVKKQEGDVLDKLMACIAGFALEDASATEQSPSDRNAHAADLHKSLGLDMADYWTARTDNFFDRARKSVSLHAIREIAGEEAEKTAAKMKTPAARETAETVLKTHHEKGGSKWLPDILRKPQP